MDPRIALGARELALRFLRLAQSFREVSRIHAGGKCCINELVGRCRSLGTALSGLPHLMAINLEELSQLLKTQPQFSSALGYSLRGCHHLCCVLEQEMELITKETQEARVDQLWRDDAVKEVALHTKAQEAVLKILTPILESLSSTEARKVLALKEESLKEIYKRSRSIQGPVLGLSSFLQPVEIQSPFGSWQRTAAKATRPREPRKADGRGGLVPYLLPAAKTLVDPEIKTMRPRRPVTARASRKLAAVRSLKVDPNVDLMGALLEAINLPDEATATGILDEGLFNTNFSGTQGVTILIAAAKHGMAAVVEQLVKAGAPIEERYPGKSALMKAAEYGHPDIVALLMQHNARIEAKDQQGMTALHHACRRGHAEVVEMLIRNKADVQSLDGQSRSPLKNAAEKGRVKVLDVLVSAGVDIRSRGGKALHHALAKDSAAVIEFLVWKGADVDAENGQGRTLLHRAAAKGYLECIRVLLDCGALVDGKGSTEHTPLYEAITAGQVAAIELLLRRKASMNSIAAGDQTALHVALECKGRERVRVLIKCGANIEAVNASGALPVHCAAKAGLVDAMDMLLEAGADINAPMRDKSQKTPLHEAAFWGQTEMGSFLVEKGVSLKSKSKGDQMTVLHYAALGGQEALAEQLMLQDIDKNARNSDLDTPLHIAVREGSLSITRILVEGGASVKPLNRAMNTSLHIAAEKGNATIVEYLLRHNTDATKRNRAGRSALDLATGNGHKDVVSLLLNGVAPLPEERYTPLMSSVASGTISGVAALIRNGADINASCKGETALHLATSANKVAITELLLKAGARDSPTAGEGKETALHGASADGQTALVKLLLDHGGDVNVRAARSRATPLMKAARNGRLLVMELLQARGAEINARDENGNTALCHAVLGNELASARVLLRLGANLHFCNRDDQKMPIHIAAANGDCTMASFLLTKGASLTAKSGEGLTALDYARKHPGSLTEKVISAFAQKR